jgi:hypothetical protein
MKHLLLIPCLLLCSCFVEEEADPENTQLSSPSIDLPSSSSVKPAGPSILDCPPEDIAEYPVLDPLPDNWGETTLPGDCASKLKVSIKELSFGAQGGVRCITADRPFGITAVVKDGKRDEDCLLEDKFGWVGYKKVACPWLMATKVEEDDRVVLISVNQNETGEERKLVLHIAILYCGTTFTITQSPN